MVNPLKQNTVQGSPTLAWSPYSANHGQSDSWKPRASFDHFTPLLLTSLSYKPKMDSLPWETLFPAGEELQRQVVLTVPSHMFDQGRSDISEGLRIFQTPAKSPKGCKGSLTAWDISARICTEGNKTPKWRMSKRESGFCSPQGVIHHCS